MKPRSGAFLALAAATATAGAMPAMAAGPDANRPMQVVLARSAQDGCEPQCPEWISAQGRIDPGTLDRFRKVIGRLGNRKVPILIDSAGGTVDEAIAIGRLVRSKGLDVIVTQTVLKTCAKEDAACQRHKSRDVHPALPRTPISKFVSSCAFILAGGIGRYVGPAAFVGLHQVASFHVQARVLNTYRVTTQYMRGIPVAQTKQLVSQKKIGEKVTPTETTAKTYDGIKAFFVQMGIAETVMPLLMSAPHTSLRVLTRTELRSTALATEFLTGENVLLGVKPAPEPATTLPPLIGQATAAATPASAPASAAPASTAAPGLTVTVPASDGAATAKAEPAAAAVASTTPAAAAPAPVSPSAAPPTTAAPPIAKKAVKAAPKPALERTARAPRTAPTATSNAAGLDRH